MDEKALERAQQKAAELVLEDESWRDGLDDAGAQELLDEALALIEQALAHHSAEGAMGDDLPYVLADQARAMLREKAASLVSGEPAEETTSE